METTDLTKKRRKKGEGRLAEFNKNLRSCGRLSERQPPGEEIQCQCRYDCKNIGHDQKVSLFNQFYQLGDNVKQNSYLMGLISVCGVKRRRHGSYVGPTASRRQASVFFTIPDGKGVCKQVCKKTFLDVFGITKRRVETLVKAKKRGDVTYNERRGNKIRERKYSVEDERLIIEHIDALPKEESHYTRAKSSNLYLSPDLNYNKLHASFVERNPTTTVKYGYFKKIVRQKFPKLRFHRPRQDTCNTCDLLHSKIMNDSVNRVKNRASLELHYRKAESARTAMKNDHQESQTPTSNMCTMAIDLEKVLSLHALTHCQMYYLRQLSCYNLGIHKADSNKGLMFLWHEGMSGRGGNEIASCVLKAIKSNITHKKQFVIWSDNCCGQNKNKMIVFLWIYLVCNGYADEIHHKFVVSGHSYLSCDRDFAIKKKKKESQV